MLSFLKKAIFASLLLAVVVSGVPFRAFAAGEKYAALRVTTTGSGNITMTPGEVKNIGVTFQNTGTETWKNDGTGYISLYTYEPKYRASAFDPGSWLSPSQVKRLVETSVKPGATGSLLFNLKAPQTEGTFKETFALASESQAWVNGGTFTLTIKVQKASATAVKTPASSADTAVTAPSAGYSASVVTQTATKLKVVAKKQVSFMAVIKNTGSKTWKSVGISSSAMNIASTGTTADDFRHKTWSGSEVALLTQSVKPGESATVQFFFTAPATNGTRNAKFQITADGQDVPGAFVEIPVEVTGGSGEVLNSPVTETPVPVAANLISEPTMRVGVLIVDEETDDEVYVTSNESDFELRDVDGKLLGSYTKGTKVHAEYANGKYIYGEQDEKTLKPIRFVPLTANAVMSITNFDRRVTRKAAKAYNTFRNVLELRYNKSKDRTWIINELPLEYYLRGLAETSNVSPMDFQEALLTAARTYAFYHWTHASKHAAEGYHVDAYLDQVYWGYGQEEQTPRITEAVEATRGMIVTYNGETAITPYFSRSDGHTRDWSEVWGGNVPWVKGVPVPCDKGKTLWGHGVGMSASGALCMANQGMNWKDILTYFYTGVAITQTWK
jgi:hypothetical protein